MKHLNELPPPPLEAHSRRIVGFHENFRMLEQLLMAQRLNFENFR